MAIYHCATKSLSRSTGRSAVAAAAYRSGDCLCDERQGLEHDYTRRSGVAYTELVLPDEAGEWSREELWNAAEQAEKRKDARTAREWEIALPAELSEEERQELAVGFAQGLAERYGCAVDVAVHTPDREGDERNWHAHLLTTTRTVGAENLGEKCVIELSDSKRQSLGLAPVRKEVAEVRALWAEHANRALREAGRSETVDHRSLAAQRDEAERQGHKEKAAILDREPQSKLGWRVVQMERRGVSTDRGDQLRAVQQSNQERHTLITLRDHLQDRLTRSEALQHEANLNRIVRSFQGLGRYSRAELLRQWEYKASQPLPDRSEARQHWEQSKWDPSSQEWQSAKQAVAHSRHWVERDRQTWDEQRQQHPIRAKLADLGLRAAPEPLRMAQESYSRSLGHLERAEQRFTVAEQAWDEPTRLRYEGYIDQEGQAIQQAQRDLATIAQNRPYFEQVWAREAQALKDKQHQERERGSRKSREPNRERDDDGWSR